MPETKTYTGDDNHRASDRSRERDQRTARAHT